jgi:hypothetical protein
MTLHHSLLDEDSDRGEYDEEDSDSEEEEHAKQNQIYSIKQKISPTAIIEESH